MHAIKHAVVVAPEPGFVVDGFGKQLAVDAFGRLGFAEQLLEQDRRNFLVTIVAEVNTVDGQSFVATSFGKTLFRVGKQIDEPNFFRCSDRLHRIGIGLKNLRALGCIGEVILFHLLHRDRRHQHNLWR